jgi:hypothetical protein
MTKNTAENGAGGGVGVSIAQEFNDCRWGNFFFRIQKRHQNCRQKKFLTTKFAKPVEMLLLSIIQDFSELFSISQHYSEMRVERCMRPSFHQIMVDVSFIDHHC